ncbi:hypothetical protein A3Q56_04386 [Intoshia linei]|uniref:Uncharacterized protein n=1 Tax=Intoshia linei TaxID=1819745 RepID=A0A177B0Y0_9BILA|nr:hypothetical protein A3Q56_04386 [Intoshia linei]
MTKNCKIIANGTAETYDPNNLNIVSKYFERVGRHTFVESNEVINLIWPCDTNDLKLFIKILKKNGKLKRNEHKLVKKRRKERYPNQVILLMGKWNEKNPSDEIEIYNIYTNVWHSIEGKLFINEKNYILHITD